MRLLAETGFPAERLVVEITESSLFADIDLARTIVTSLKNQGIRLALDDFGTGFSSLSHLRSLPFDVIKIDRSFVTNVHAKRGKRGDRPRRDDAGAARSTVPVCVEGIEDEATYDAVVRLRLRVGQGWYFGKPMSGEQARELLDRATAAPTPQTARQPPATAELLEIADRSVPRWDGGSRSPHARVVNMVKTALRISPCSRPRPHSRSDPRRFGRRRACAAAPSATGCPPSALSDDLQAVRDDLRRRLPVRVDPDRLIGLAQSQARWSFQPSQAADEAHRRDQQQLSDRADAQAAQARRRAASR